MPLPLNPTAKQILLATALAAVIFTLSGCDDEEGEFVAPVGVTLPVAPPTSPPPATPPPTPTTPTPPPPASTAPPPTTTTPPSPEPQPVSAAPLFPNSIVSNDLAFITLDDEAMGYCVALRERGRREMPGGASGNLFESDVFVFESQFDDGTTVEIWASARFPSEASAQSEADEIVKRLAILPSFMRETLNRVILHTGDGGAFAEDIDNFFVVYRDNMEFRRSENDMEETLFHESVHATLDIQFRDNDPAWRAAQENDPGFITEYARDRITEDLAESAIFAFSDKYTPTRLPQDVTEQMYTIMPARIRFIRDIFPPRNDYFVTYRAATACP